MWKECPHINHTLVSGPRVSPTTAMNALVLARRRRAGGPSHPVGAAPHATACMETDRNDAGDRAFGFAVEK